MPRAPRRRIRRGKKAFRARRRGGKIGSPMPAIAEKHQAAHILETIDFGSLDPNKVVQCTFTLAQFSRASRLAPNFQYYKAVSAEWTYEPLYNTFQDSATALSKPYMYTLMNRNQETPFTNVNSQNLPSIQAAGAKPVALASTKKVRYRPNWCSPGLIAVRTYPSNPSDYSMSGLKVQYGWLETPNAIGDLAAGAVQPNAQQLVITGQSNPNTTPVNLPVNTNTVVYNGHLTYLDQFIAGVTPPPICRLTLTVKWAFKGAMARYVVPATTITEVE